jgi:gas vesicle protein
MADPKTAAQAGIAGFVVGTAVGAILGILYAPRSGEETRQMIREEAANKRDAINQKVGEMQEGIANKKDELVQKIEDLKAKTEELEEEVKESSKRAKKIASK